MTEAKRKHWYQMAKKKHVTGFTSAKQKFILKRFAREQDLTLARYVTRVLEKHIADRLKEEKTRPPGTP